MSFDMPFYETEQVKPAPQRRSSENDWKEENIDLDGLVKSQSNTSQPDHQVPTFNSINVSRPSVLNINIPQNKATPPTCRAQVEQAAHYIQQRRPQMFTYEPQISPTCSPGHPAVSPASVSPASHHTPSPGPVSPYSHPSPVSPSRAPVHSPTPPQMSPIPQAHSPYSGRSGSVSPVSPHHGMMGAHPAVFGRYADYMSGYSSCDMDDGRRVSPLLDKNSELYKAKRERNNVAVRRSREKKKQREMENERKVKELSDENNHLQNKLSTVVKELNMLKSLYKTIGVSLPPEAQHKLNTELAKISNTTAATSS